MNKHELTALAERVEAAEGPSRELDEAISLAVRGRGFDTDLRKCYGPAYTASTDAALTLVPEGSPMELHIRSNMTDAYVWPDDREDGIRGHAATPALALTAAALKARATVAAALRQGEDHAD